MNYLYVEYHSVRWFELTEQGFITLEVDDYDIAKMVKVK